MLFPEDTLLLKFSALATALVTAASLHGDVITQITSPGGLASNDSVNWSQLGADQTTIPNTFSAVSVLGNAISGSFATSTGQVATVCPVGTGTCSWNTSGTGINAGDTAIWTINPSANPSNDGPLTLAFGTGVLGGGAWLQANETDIFAVFTAQLNVYNNATLLATYTVNSDSNGDPVFLGALDSTGANVTSMIFSVTAVPADANVNDFALDTLLLTSPVSSSTPEPASFGLLTAGLAGLAWKLRRRTSSK